MRSLFDCVFDAFVVPDVEDYVAMNDLVFVEENPDWDTELQQKWQYGIRLNVQFLY